MHTRLLPDPTDVNPELQLQVEAPEVLDEPAGQLKQPPCPVLGWYCPMGQGLQPSHPPLLYQPAGQVPHPVDPVVHPPLQQLQA